MISVILLTQTVQVAIEKGFDNFTTLSLEQRICNLFAKIAPTPVATSAYFITWHLLPYSLILSYFEQTQDSPLLGNTIQIYFNIPRQNSKLNGVICVLVYIIAVCLLKTILGALDQGLNRLFLSSYDDYLYDLEQIFPPKFGKFDVISAILDRKSKPLTNVFYIIPTKLRFKVCRPGLNHSRPYQEWRKNHLQFKNWLATSALKDQLCPLTNDLILLPIKNIHGDKTYEKWPRTSQLIEDFFKQQYDSSYVEYVDDIIAQEQRLDLEYLKRVANLIKDLDTSHFATEHRDGLIAYLKEVSLVNNLSQQELDPLQSLIEKLTKENMHDHPRVPEAPPGAPQ